MQLNNACRTGKNATMAMQIQEKIEGFLSRQYQVEIEEISLDDNLVDQGVIDSFAFVEIAAFLEEKFNIIIEDDQIIPDNFSSIGRIINFVGSQLAQRGMSS